MADRSGQVFSAVVLKSSGLKAADQQAIELSRTARFRITRAADSGGLGMGTADLSNGACAGCAPGATGGETPARGL
jgi:hypothetical protein